jgi:hypothetical protein
MDLVQIGSEGVAYKEQLRIEDSGRLFEWDNELPGSIKCEISLMSQ